MVLLTFFFLITNLTCSPFEIIHRTLKHNGNDPQIILMFQRLLSLLIGSGFHQEDIASLGFGSHGALCQVTTAEVRHLKVGLH